MAVALAACGDESRRHIKGDGYEIVLTDSRTFKYDGVRIEVGKAKTSFALGQGDHNVSQGISLEETLIVIMQEGAYLATITVRNDSRTFAILPTPSGVARVSVGDLDADGNIDSLVYQARQGDRNSRVNIVDMNLDGQNDVKVTWNLMTHERTSSELWFDGAWRMAHGDVPDQTVEVGDQEVPVVFDPTVGFVRSNHAIEPTR